MFYKQNPHCLVVPKDRLRSWPPRIAGVSALICVEGFKGLPGDSLDDLHVTFAMVLQQVHSHHHELDLGWNQPFASLDKWSPAHRLQGILAVLNGLLYCNLQRRVFYL